MTTQPMIDTQPVKGTRDFYPDDMRQRRWLFEHWRVVAESFGFEEYDACVLESADLYIRKAGDEITGQLYDLRDKSDRHLALRPEMTPTLARMVLAKGSALPLPIRWWGAFQCFRYERMQRGRKREHFQWNMDIVGLAGPAAEVELMSAQAAFLRRVGLGEGVAFRVSDRRVLQAFLTDAGLAPELFPAVCVVVDKFDKIGREACLNLLTGQTTVQGEGDEAARGAEVKLALDPVLSGKILDLLAVRGLADLEKAVGPNNPGFQGLSRLMALAQAAGIADCISIDCSVVRGLSYYTGTVWELFDASGDMSRAIAGGGRYDQLLNTFGGQPQPMVGFGFGDVVILDILNKRGLIPPLSRNVDDVIFPMAEDGDQAALALATKLRAQGRRVWTDLTHRRFKHVVGNAETLGAEKLWILGQDELARGVAKVRTMADRTEAEVALGA